MLPAPKLKKNKKKEKNGAKTTMSLDEFVDRCYPLFTFLFQLLVLQNMLPAPKSKKNKKKEKSGAKTTMSLDEFVDRDYQVVEDENGVLHKMPIV